MTEDVEMTARTTKPDDIMEIFSYYTDQRGKVAVNTFEDIVEEHRTSMSESTIRKLLDYADKNKDGYISREEILKLNNEDESKIARNAGVKVKDVTLFKKGQLAVGNFILPKEEERKVYYQRYSCCPPPLFMILITVAEVAVYIYYSATYDEWITYPKEIIRSPLIFYPPLRGQAWRFISYMFLHAGLEHILFNMLLQIILGVPLELVHGSLRVAAIYLSGVLGGSMASSIFEPSVSLVGASGGVYAILTAQLANVILNGDVMSKIGSLIRTVLVVFVLCADFGYAIYRRFANDGPNAVSFAAHVAGTLAGITMGLIVLKNFQKSLRDKIVFWIALAVYISFMIFGIFWNAFWPNYPESALGE